MVLIPGMGSHLVCCSQLQSIAIRPTAPDPSQSTVRCITAGHGKASFSGIKKVLHGVCWIIVIVALVLSFCASQILMEHLEKNEKKMKNEKKAAKKATVFLLYTVCLAEVVLIIAIIIMIIVSDSDFIDWCFCFFFFGFLAYNDYLC